MARVLSSRFEEEEDRAHSRHGRRRIVGRTSWDARRGRPRVIGVDSFIEYYNAPKRANLAGSPMVRLSLWSKDLNGSTSTVSSKASASSITSPVNRAFGPAGRPSSRSTWRRTSSRPKSCSRRRRLRRSKFVLASSSSVYGQAERFPTSEPDRPRPVSPYGVTKLAAENLCHLYHQAFGCRP